MGKDQTSTAASKRVSKTFSNSPSVNTKHYPQPDWRCKECGCPANLTPMIRPGPLGKKTICNACYIRYKVKSDKALRGSARPSVDIFRGSATSDIPDPHLAPMMAPYLIPFIGGGGLMSAGGGSVNVLSHSDNSMQFGAASFVPLMDASTGQIYYGTNQTSADFPQAFDSLQQQQQALQMNRIEDILSHQQQQQQQQPSNSNASPNSSLSQLPGTVLLSQLPELSNHLQSVHSELSNASSGMKSPADNTSKNNKNTKTFNVSNASSPNSVGIGEEMIITSSSVAPSDNSRRQSSRRQKL